METHFSIVDPDSVRATAEVTWSCASRTVVDQFFFLQQSQPPSRVGVGKFMFTELNHSPEWELGKFIIDAPPRSH
jgi:hypothetical protein